MKKVVYIGGKFTGKNSWEIHRNVFYAESLGLAVAEAGAMPLIPHKNTSNFFGTMTEEFWYEGTLELLKRCDAMILVSGWEDSKGTKAEVEWARDNGIPVLESVGELKAWLAGHACPATSSTAPPRHLTKRTTQPSAMDACSRYEYISGIVATEWKKV